MMGLMLGLLVFSYLLGFLAFLSLWQLSRFVHLPLMARRVLFCALGTVILAPMIAPAGVAVVYVPNGLVLLISLGAGAPLGQVLGDYLELSRFTLPSFGVTARVFALIAWRAVKADAGPLKNRWIAVALPAVALLGIFQVFRFVLPDRGIPDELDNAVVEEAYGPLLDEVGNLVRIADPQEQRAEVARLTAAFESVPAILEALLYEPGATVRGEIFFFSRERKPYSSESCANRTEAHRNRLSRCTREHGGFDRSDLLRYRHPYETGGKPWIIAVYLEYDAAIRVLTSGADRHRSRRLVASCFENDVRCRPDARPEGNRSSRESAGL